jgi:hypothetical protein
LFFYYTGCMEFNFEKVYEDNILTIEIDTGKSFIYLCWLQHPDSENLRQSFALAAEFAIIRNCQYWLSDARAVHYLEFADQNWMLQFMVPLLRTSHLVKYARINSEESLSLLDMDRIVENIESSASKDNKGKVAVFVDRQSALDWLFLPSPSPKEFASQESPEAVFSPKIN